MSLLSLPIGRKVTSSTRRRPKAFRPRLQPDLEDLEVRTVLSGGGHAAAVASAVTSPLTITGAQITNLAVTGANSLLATLNLSGTLNTVTGSTPFQLNNIQLPITLNSIGQTTYTNTNGTTDTCPILHLSLQIPDLNILGLHVQLDNCSGGPVTVDVTAIPTGQTDSAGDAGGVLGDLLCSVDNLLTGPGGGLLNLGSQTGAVTGALTQALNGVLTDLTSGLGGVAGAATTDAAPVGSTDLVNLHLAPINLDVLGLDVQTSPICLDVYAVPGGGLLGSLLSNLDNLLSNPATAVAQNALVQNIVADLQRLGL